MSDKNYSQRDSAGALDGTEVFPVWDNGSNSKTDINAIVTYFLSTTRNGSFAGTFNGDVTADYLFFGPGDAMTASGVIPDGSYLNLNHETVKIEASVVPVAGRLLIVTQTDAGTVGHTLTTAGTFDGTNNTATFNAKYETLVLLAIDTTRWVILGNFGSVGLSSVP